MLASQRRRIFKPHLARRLSSCSILRSGHNRWSKIKHDKAKVDASTTRQRTVIAHELRLASKDHGPDPRFNSRLAGVIAAAKKQGFPKASIENAIARGQGKTPGGAPLECLSIEAMLPQAVAVIIECQTDSKLRTLADLKNLVTRFGGAVSPSNHLFDKRGKVVLENPNGLTEDEIFDEAIEAGATDIEVEDDTIVLFTEPDQTMAAAQRFSETMGSKVLSSNIIWRPKEELMTDIGEPEKLAQFIDRVHDDPAVQDVYINAR